MHRTHQTPKQLLAYHSVLLFSSREMAPVPGKKNVATEFKLKDDVTIFVIVNHPFVYSKRWYLTLSIELLGLSIHQMDAIVLGSFNEYDGSKRSSFFNTTKLYEKEVPKHRVAFGKEPPPYVKDIALRYKGPIVWMSMFAKYNEARHQEALAMIRVLRQKGESYKLAVCAWKELCAGYRCGMQQ